MSVYKDLKYHCIVWSIAEILCLSVCLSFNFFLEISLENSLDKVSK